MMLLGFLASCSDNNVKDLEPSKVEIEQISQEKSSASLEPEVKISCNGDCGSGLPVCGVRYGGGEFWCDCDVNCSMTVEGTGIKYISGSLKNTMNHVISVIGEEEMKSRSIRGIEIGFDRERNVEVVWFERIGKDKEIYTSAILLTYTTSKIKSSSLSFSTGIEVGLFWSLRRQPDIKRQRLCGGL